MQFLNTGGSHWKESFPNKQRMPPVLKKQFSLEVQK